MSGEDEISSFERKLDQNRERLHQRQSKLLISTPRKANSAVNQLKSSLADAIRAKEAAEKSKKDALETARKEAEGNRLAVARMKSKMRAAQTAQQDLVDLKADLEEISKLLEEKEEECGTLQRQIADTTQRNGRVRAKHEKLMKESYQAGWQAAVKSTENNLKEKMDYFSSEQKMSSAAALEKTVTAQEEEHKKAVRGKNFGLVYNI